MLRSSAIASCAALKRALSASPRPLILARSIVTAPNPISSRLAILNLCDQTPGILFSPPPPPSSPFGAASARGFATATRDDDSDSDADGGYVETDDDMLGLIDAADSSDMDYLVENDDFVEEEDEDD